MFEMNELDRSTTMAALRTTVIKLMLLENSCKSTILANRMSKFMEEIIHELQTAYLFQVESLKLIKQLYK